jgi:glyoxylase-like metal-dependent hydrolase (beta-lactamase superfamily II)
MLFGNIAEVDGNNRGFNGNAGFVVTESGVVVIDALGTPKLGKRLIATIRKVTSQPIRYLIITHNHPDHAYGAVAFRELGGVTIIAHPGTLDYLGSDRLARSLAYRRTFIAPDMEGFQAVEPDFLVRVPRYENYSFRAGEQTFRVYNTGHHHSHGDLVVYQENAGIVWISDLAFNDRVTFIGDGSSNEAIESLDWLKTAFPEAKLMVPGHGSAQTPPFPMIDRTRDYIQRMRDLMAQAVEEGLGMQEAVDQAELPDWQKVRLYDLNQRPNANFIFREMEAELF